MHVYLLACWPITSNTFALRPLSLGAIARPERIAHASSLHSKMVKFVRDSYPEGCSYYRTIHILGSGKSRATLLFFTEVAADSTDCCLVLENLDHMV